MFSLRKREKSLLVFIVILRRTLLCGVCAARAFWLQSFQFRHLSSFDTCALVSLQAHKPSAPAAFHPNKRLLLSVMWLLLLSCWLVGHTQEKRARGKKKDPAFSIRTSGKAPQSAPPPPPPSHHPFISFTASLIWWENAATISSLEKSLNYGTPSRLPIKDSH